jgi:hypothetical protein
MFQKDRCAAGTWTASLIEIESQFYEKIEIHVPCSMFHTPKRPLR